MTPPEAIHLVTRDARTAHTVREIVDTAELQLVVHDELTGAALTLERTVAHLVLVDIDGHPERLLADLEPIIARMPETRFAAVASEVRQEWLIRAMQSGTRHFMLKSTLPTELPGVLSKTRPSVSPLNGDIYGVIGAGGGCGATTLALNLTAELADLGVTPALAIDLDAHRAGLGGHLGLEAEYGVADVLHAGDRLDAGLIRSSTVPFGESFSVLASPVTVDPIDPRSLDLRDLGRVLQYAKSAYAATVVDAPMITPEVAETIARASAATFIVFEMTVGHVRTARNLMSSLRRRGVDPGTIVPVANRYPTRKSGVTIDEARKVLEVSTIQTIDNDYSTVIRSINMARPLVGSSPRSGIRKSIRQLATQVRERSQYRASA